MRFSRLNAECILVEPFVGDFWEQLPAIPRARETLMAVHTRRHTYDPNEPLTPWVYAIARYKLIDYLRQSQPELAHVPIENAEEVFARDDRNASESTLDLNKLLALLPDRTRKAIQYVKLDGLNINEAAARCGVTPSAVKVIVHRSLKSLSAILVMFGRHAEARRMFERLLDLRNDVGLLAEEYDPRSRRQLGNFPQAFSHIALANTARNLSAAVARRPAAQRSS